MNMRVVAIAAVMGLGLSGCGSSQETAAEPEQVVVTVTAEAEPEPSDDPTEFEEATEEDDPFAPNVGDRALKVGQARKGQGFTMTLLEIKDPVQPSDEYSTPSKGNRFFGVRISQCMKKSAERGDFDYSSDSSEWYVGDREGNQYTEFGFTTLQPEFPESVTVNPGECLKGWLVIEVPSKVKASRVIYRPLGETVAEWTL